MPDTVLVDNGWCVVLVPEDWSGLTQTVATISCLHSRYPLTQGDVVQFLMRNGAELLLAKDGSSIEGFALIIPEESPQQTPVLRIHALAVDPEFRRNGLGRVLLHGVYARAGKLGTRPVMTIADDDGAGKRFLNALGFRAKGPRTEGRREFRGSLQGPPATTATVVLRRRQPPAGAGIR